MHDNCFIRVSNLPLTTGGDNRMFNLSTFTFTTAIDKNKKSAHKSLNYLTYILNKNT